MHTVAIFAGFFAMSAAMPGADTMLMLGYSLGSGPRSAIPLAAGMTLGKVLLLALAAAGVSAVASEFASYFVFLKIGGGCYLAWLGVRMWRRDKEAKLVAAQRSPSASKAMGTGFVLTISNPQAVLFYVSVLPAVLGETISPARYAVLAVTLCCVMTLVATFYIGLGARARSMTTNLTARTLAERIAGGVLILAGALVALK